MADSDPEQSGALRIFRLVPNFRTAFEDMEEGEARERMGKVALALRNLNENGFPDDHSIDVGFGPVLYISPPP